MYIDFKRKLELAYGILNWSPTNEQLRIIAKHLEKNPTKTNEVRSYISDICGNVTFSLFEGVDNADLNTLLALAKKMVREEN